MIGQHIQRRSGTDLRRDMVIQHLPHLIQLAALERPQADMPRDMIIKRCRRVIGLPLASQVIQPLIIPQLLVEQMGFHMFRMGAVGIAVQRRLDVGFRLLQLPHLQLGKGQLR